MISNFAQMYKEQVQGESEKDLPSGEIQGSSLKNNFQTPQGIWKLREMVGNKKTTSLH